MRREDQDQIHPRITGQIWKGKETISWRGKSCKQLVAMNDNHIFTFEFYRNGLVTDDKKAEMLANEKNLERLSPNESSQQSIENSSDYNESKRKKITLFS